MFSLGRTKAGIYPFWEQDDRCVIKDIVAIPSSISAITVMMYEIAGENVSLGSGLTQRAHIAGPG